MADDDLVEKTQSGIWLVAGGAIVSALWIGGLLVYVLLLDEGDLAGFEALFSRSPNELGDFLAGAFAPLAFLWLLLAVLLQRQELSKSTETLKLQARELRSAVEQYSAQATALQEQEKIDRLQLVLTLESFYIERITYALHEISQRILIYPSVAVMNNVWSRYASGERLAVITHFVQRIRYDHAENQVREQIRKQLSHSLSGPALQESVLRFAAVLNEYRDRVSRVDEIGFVAEIAAANEVMHRILEEFPELYQMFAALDKYAVASTADAQDSD